MRCLSNSSLIVYVIFLSTCDKKKEPCHLEFISSVLMGTFDFEGTETSLKRPVNLLRYF